MAGLRELLNEQESQVMNKSNQCNTGEDGKQRGSCGGCWALRISLLLVVLLVAGYVIDMVVMGRAADKQNANQQMTTMSSLDENGLPLGYPFQPDWEVTPREVKAMMDRGEDILFLDCREPEEYQRTHVEGTVLVPMGEIANRLEELREYDERPVVVICRSGKRSLIVANQLRLNDFDDVKSVAGGTNLWSQAVDDSVQQY
ncbi:rhodanese-like domain-containing protein [Planctomycetota bacterium]|nr:rhodanese-like domain-containing protein [Planctomycetota bacterium]